MAKKTQRQKLFERTNELVQGIEACGYSAPAWTWIAHKDTTIEQIIAFGKKLRQLHDAVQHLAAINALGYQADKDLCWFAEADYRSVKAYRRVHCLYLRWCQEHKAAVARVRAAWRVERDAGSDNPADELAMNTDDLTPAELATLAARIEQRNAAMI
jgi:hypothetical protein